MNITEKEITLLKAVRDDQYHDGRDPINDPVWSWSPVDTVVRETGTARNVWSGVACSTAKKGFTISEGEGEDATIRLTQAGADVLRHASLTAALKNLPLPG